jgi:carbonic anhydrase
MKVQTTIITFLFCFNIASAATQKITPDRALEMLLEGNDHFVKGKSTHPSYVAEAKDKLLEQQTPFARVPPELIFDRGLGDLFVIRDAGNVIGPIEMDSAAFAVAKLNVPLVIVLGHQNCGAVKAALLGKDNVPELQNIFPLIDSALKGCDTIGENALVNAIHCNVKKSVEILKNSPMIAPLLAQKKVKIIGGYYDIATGKVTLTSF